MGIQSESALAQAYTLVETGEAEQAKRVLEQALTADLDNNDLVFAVHCCNFWLDTLEALPSLDGFDQSEALVSQWKQFRVLVASEKNPSERTVYAFKKCVFSLALEGYNVAGSEKNSRMRAEICRKIGLCYKKLGSYETALSHLTEANTLSPGSAPVLAEMADCYDLCGETNIAKVLFREAFFVGAKDIDLAFLDSPLISLVVQETASHGHVGRLLQEWIPVYGVIMGVFNKTRELRSQEVGHLLQDIYAEENALKDAANDRMLITPRLMNLYLRLMDFYMATKASSQKLTEVRLKIKILDPEIYNALYART